MTDLKISGFSTALYSTWFFVEPFRLLLDCGDGASALLGQKTRKVRTIAITHADRDHLAGLLQFNQLNARDGLPAIYYPSHCGSFPALASFADRFDPHIAGQLRWAPIADGESVEFERDLSLVARSNQHKPAAPGETKSLGYQVVRRKRRLKAEFRKLSGKELAALAQEHGRDHLNDEAVELILSYSGDTPVGDPGIWKGSHVLIHEATFLTEEDAAKQHAAHSNLPAVLDALRDVDLGKVILAHFSARYRPEQVTETVREQARSMAFPHPIWVVPPHQVMHGILDGDPVWRP